MDVELVDDKLARTRQKVPEFRPNRFTSESIRGEEKILARPPSRDRHLFIVAVVVSSEAGGRDRCAGLARGAAASLREEVAALKQQHAKELAAEKEASEGIVLAVQAEKTNFEAFVREMSRQILGTCDFVETATPRECLSTATARIIACAGEILAALPLQ
nr:uncharacterized protein LOC127327067 [Lolium perenne]